MLVREIMSHHTETIAPTDTLREAAIKMRSLNIGALPVMVDTKLVGVITDRDICCRGVAEGLDPDISEVREVMSRSISFCFSDDTVNEAVRQMEEQQIQRLAVMNHDKTVAGFLSVDDVAHYSRQLAGEVLDAVAPMRHVATSPSLSVKRVP